MLSFFRRLLWDETAFIGVLRAALMGFGGALATDLVSLDEIAGLSERGGDLLAILSLGAGGYIRSSSAGKKPPSDGR